MTTLKELVNEITKIKNELKTCHTKLKSNLLSKGITIATTDKMLNLINKISSIEVPVSVVASDNVFIDFSDYVTCGAGRDTVNVMRLPVTFKGSVRVTFRCNTDYAGASAICTVSHIRSEVTIKNQVFTADNSSKWIDFSYDIDNFLIGDILSIDLKCSSNHTARIQKIKIKGDVV